MRLLEPFGSGFGQNRRRKRAEDFAVLDATVEDLLHLWPSWIRHDAAIAKRARSPFRATLEPTQDPSVCDQLSGLVKQGCSRQLGDREAVGRGAAGFYRSLNLFAREAR